MSRAWAALVLAVLLGTAGCGGEDPSASPPPSSPTVSSHTAPTPPALPAAAKKDTKAGAIAFVRHYVDLINYAQATGDVDDWRTASTTSCSTCRGVATDVAELYDRGGSIDGGAWTIARVRADRDRRTSGWLVLVRIRAAKQTVNQPGRKVQSFKAGLTTHEFLVVDRNGWKVARWNHVG